jgi:NitT/TauT family transport system permease protein
MWSAISSTLNWRGLASVLGFFILWYMACILELAGFTEMANPIEVIQMFLREYIDSTHYWFSWLTSFQRVLYGFLFAQLLGIPLGLFFGSSQKFRHLFFPVFELLRPIPPLAWVPMSILFWPTNESSIIFITFIGAFFVIVINVFEGVRAIKKEHLLLALSMGVPKWSIFLRIMLPSVIPSIAVGMTLGIAITWDVVIAAEMIASDSGLGRLTWEGYVSSTPEVLVIGMISIGVAGFLSTKIVYIVEKRMMPWRKTNP